jgi:phosphoribosylamine--glycine ligase
MHILLLGSGGREHALAWKLAQSPLCSKLYAAPGNPGIAQDAELVALDATDHGAVIAFCDEQRIGLVVIGPEAPLVDGLADSLRGKAFPCSARARPPPSSKAQGLYQGLVRPAGIPTAGYVRATSATPRTRRSTASARRW